MHHTLTTADGLDLHLTDWPATTPRPQGRIVLVHGLGEHIGRYAHVAAALQAAGWSVLGYDQRGHGRSGGARGDIGQDDSLLRDLAQVLDVARQRGDGPLLLLGHSMGGLVAARFVAESLRPMPADWSRTVDALVLSSPAIDPGVNAVQRLLLAVVPRLLPHLCVGNGLDADWISRDPQVVRAYREDPLVHDRISGLLGRFIASQGEAVLEVAGRWRTPTLLMWAGADRCVSPAGSQRLAAALPMAVAEHQPWPALAHEIFNEPERAEVLARLLRWLEDRAGAGR